MELVGRADARDVDPRQLARLLEPDQRRAVALGVARVDREQLVDRRERARELGQVEKPELLDAVDERVERVQRATVRGAERDERARVGGAAEDLDEVARDHATHRVGDEDDLGVGMRLAPAAEPGLELQLELAGGDPVVAAPVVRELEVRLAGHELQPLLEALRDLGVAVDLPEPREDVHIPDEASSPRRRRRGRRRPAGLLEPQVLDAVPAAEQAPEDRSRGGRPDLLAVALEHAARDAGDEDDDVGLERHVSAPRSKRGRPRCTARARCRGAGAASCGTQ